MRAWVYRVSSLLMSIPLALLCVMFLQPEAQSQSGGGAPPAQPKDIYCTTACPVSGIKVGQNALIMKGNTTSRASTTTLTADPDLQFTSIPLGQYNIESFIQFSGASAGGDNQDWAATAASFFDLNVVTLCSGTGLVTFVTATGQSTGCTSLTTTVNNIYQRGIANSLSGTLSINWAQNSSNATASALTNTSFLRITRMQ